jgi:hypothetical protein
LPYKRSGISESLLVPQTALQNRFWRNIAAIPVMSFKDLPK